MTLKEVDSGRETCLNIGQGCLTLKHCRTQNAQKNWAQDVRHSEKRVLDTPAPDLQLPFQ